MKKKKARRPRALTKYGVRLDFDVLGAEKWPFVLITVSGVSTRLDLLDLKQLNAWLGRAIAWMEEK